MCGGMTPLRRSLRSFASPFCVAKGGRLGGGFFAALV